MTSTWLLIGGTIIVYIIIAIPTLITGHYIFPYPFFVANDLEKHLELPDDYIIDEISWITSRYEGNHWWVIYVRIEKENKPWCWTNDFVYYNMKTKEIKSDFTYDLCWQK